MATTKGKKKTKATVAQKPVLYLVGCPPPPKTRRKTVKKASKKTTRKKTRRAPTK